MYLRPVFGTAVVLLGVLATTGARPAPFAVRVVDEQSGRGVPLAELKTVSGVRFWSDSGGYVAVDDPALLGRSVFFHVSSHGYEFPKDGFGNRGVEVELSPGGETTLKVKRVNIAERLYRVTGEGIYRDSVILGKKAPLAEPLLNGQVTGQDSVMSTVYRGKVWWFWGDTHRQAYPLGHFSTAGATSELPGRGGLDPATGVDLKYFVDGSGFSRPMVPPVGGQFHWIEGLTVVEDGGGRLRLLANLTRLDGAGKAFARELIVFDDDAGVFKTLRKLDMESPFRLTGHPFRHTVDGVEYIYCGGAFPNLRVRCDWESVIDPSAYEGYAPAGEGVGGKTTWAWQRNVPPLSPEEQEERIKLGSLGPDDVPFRIRDAGTKKAIEPHAWSVTWNAFRKKWVMIFVERGGDASYLGEVWYAEAAAPEGPWRDATRILTHDRYSFYNPAQHPWFQGGGGRFVYFEGTYATTFSRDGDATPRYDYNQVMYRLDLADPRLAPPQ